MHRRLSSVLSVAFLFIFPFPVIACLWDRDTLEQERQRFPSVLELITGKFLRHSFAFYAWRANDRAQRLDQDSERLEWYDDLAVAYDKLGQHDRAIDTIMQKEQLSPGLYETYANLGTFHIHAGNYEQGLKHLQRAIEINPDAHFGREIYQQLLVEYLLSQHSGEALTLPLDREEHQSLGTRSPGFAQFVLEAQKSAGKNIEDKETRAKEIDLALKGVLGMMRFGNHDSPVLLEATGDLLLARGFPEDGKRLAVRAYLKASYETGGAASAAYRKKADKALVTQVNNLGGNTQMKLASVEEELKRELAEADAWFSELQRKELNWIENASDPEAEFAKEYLGDPQVGSANTSSFILETLPNSEASPDSEQNPR